jgi:hypothetical protein
MIRKLALIVFVLVISSCAAVDKASKFVFVSKYDTNEYELINWIRTTAELSIESCHDTELSKQNIVTLYKASLEFKNFTQYRRNNTDTYKIATSFYALVDETIQVYADQEQVSQTFCEISLMQIAGTAEVIQQAVGDKPK